MRGALVGAPHPPPRARGSVRAHRGPCRALSFSVPSPAGWVGRRPPPGPQGLAGVSKVTLRCAAAAAAARARSPPRLPLRPPWLRLQPSGGRPREHDAAPRHPPRTPRVAGGSQRLSQAQRPASHCSRRLSPGVGRDVRDLALPSFPASRPWAQEEGRLNFSRDSERPQEPREEDSQPQNGRGTGRRRAPRGQGWRWLGSRGGGGAATLPEGGGG